MPYNPKCAPARASILTGRYSWQLEEAVVHRPLMPEKWMFYPELLEASGYFVGHTGKEWVDDFINFPDVAPTLIETAGLAPHDQMTGKSFINLLLSDESGFIDSTRNFSILGKERHDIGRDDGDQIAVGYPVRAIRTRDYLYVKNYEPQREFVAGGKVK